MDARSGRCSRDRAESQATMPTKASQAQMTMASLRWWMVLGAVKRT